MNEMNPSPDLGNISHDGAFLASSFFDKVLFVKSLMLCLDMVNIMGP